MEPISGKGHSNCLSSQWIFSFVMAAIQIEFYCYFLLFLTTERSEVVPFFRAVRVKEGGEGEAPGVA